MLASKRNPVVELVKAAVGLSPASKCSCGAAAAVEAAEQHAAPEQLLETGSCGCGEEVTAAPARQNARGCGCGEEATFVLVKQNARGSGCCGH